jgi:hypothetical protein
MITVFLIKHYAMQTYGGLQAELYAFFTSAKDGGEWLVLGPGRLIRSNHWIQS